MSSILKAVGSGFGSLFFPGGSGAPKAANHISAITPPSLTDPSVANASLAARASAARAMGRASTLSTSGQGDASTPITKKTVLGG